jgi:hypothetical protein
MAATDPPDNALVQFTCPDPHCGTNWWERWGNAWAGYRHGCPRCNADAGRLLHARTDGVLLTNAEYADFQELARANWPRREAERGGG